MFEWDRLPVMPAPGVSPKAAVHELPTFYYHAHFLEMLAFVSSRYDHVLGEAEQRFLRDFSALGFPAQCLYVRLVNRRGSLFHRGRLRYPEIGDIDLALLELESRGFLGEPGIDHVDDLLHLMTRRQLVDALRPRGAAVKSSMKKGEVVDALRRHASREQLLAWLPTDNVVVQGRVEDARFVLFLFFGRIQDGLSQFTMRDLGLVRRPDRGEQYEARFSERDDAVHAYFFASRRERLHRDPHSAPLLAAEAAQWPSPQCNAAAELRDQLALELGRALDDDPALALEVFRRGESAACSERVIRTLLATGEREEARDYLERCIADPASDEEALLASDIYARKFGKKRTSELTDRLRAADVIEADEAMSGAPELAAVNWFLDRGHQAYRVENSLWRTFFGLLFWDLLCAGTASGVHSPFERVPASLTERRFATEHGAAIRERLNMLQDRGSLKNHLLRTCAAHFGASNGIFRWRQCTLDALHALIDVAPADAMRRVLEQFCENYAGARHGYPDLLVIDDAGVRFVEIKTEGDQLRRNQLLRLEQLQRAGFRADVVLLRWVLHPAQAYVVVDVETTGGRGEQHRVTEIGAVKMIGDEVVGRFQTLLNPQRSIPAGITRLTGISPAMVAEAPVFADIADALASFLDGAIFVAHNVEFDYRFIGQEFRRLGRPFRMPKLCTCASMRKLYPGHRSYSLAALTAAYDIPLKTHHRALCDAEAAAQLLIMVNEKRRETLTPPATLHRDSDAVRRDSGGAVTPVPAMISPR